MRSYSNYYTSLSSFGTLSAFWIILILIIALAIDIYLACQAANIAHDKGYTERKWFWISLLFGFIGYLLVAALPDLNLRNSLQHLAAISRESHGESHTEPTPYVPNSTNVSGNWTCSRCHAKNPSGSMFCKECGEYR